MNSTTQTHAVRVFGGIGVHSGDEPVSIGGPRQRRLLALLAIRAGSVVSNDWLAEYLWDDVDRPEVTDRALRTYVSRLRTALPETAREWIETEASGYRLAAPEAVEHHRFASLRAEARQARENDDPQRALRLLDQALDLWRGDPFRELEDLEWARVDIERLHLDRLEMLEERWESALALGRHTQIIGELAAFTSEHGLRDRAIRQYALALHRSGRTNDALRVLDDHRRRLADESGLEPSTDTLDLEQALLDDDPSLRAGKVGRPLRGYRIVEEIGSGAFSVVWRAEQPSVNRDVAIKQIRSELASQPEFIRRFEVEAHLVARIEHPHIVPLIDFWRDPDSAYLVMRWLRGGTLERRLDDGPLTVAETMQLARQIGGALAAAHGHGIVHRDVTAGNVLFDESGNAFLTDFGIALEAAESAGPEAALTPGSVAYSAPEQIRRERLQPSADVFSLGVVVFECLTGSLPFGDSGSVEQLVDRQLNVPYPDLAELRPDVPATVSAAVAKATAKAPRERFSTVGEFIDALEGGESVTSAARSSITGEVANPYKGLRAFEPGDTDQFFGRERLVQEIVARFSGTEIRSRGVALVGPSGSGKSSVVGAGLVPALRNGAVPGSHEWFVTTMVPGPDPFESLEAALLRVAVDPPKTLLTKLRDGDRGILRGIRRCLGDELGHVVVIIDQFEEVFSAAPGGDARQFLSALAVAVEDPTSPLRLVITIRADYYDRPLEHPSFARFVKEAAVEITPLAGDELERAIVEPARRVGVEYEPGLVARIAAEAVGQPSPLPMLQYTLSELFDRRSGTEIRLHEYEELGGLAGALATRAERLYAEANESERAAIRLVFGRLVNPAERSADVRRRVPVADLGSDSAVEWVLERFGMARLITFDRDDATREPTVEVAHEALLREWPRLLSWLAEDSEVLGTTDAIATAANVWEEGGQADSDLYRGGRLDSAIDLTLTAPDRLRPVDRQFVEASRLVAEADREAEHRRVRRLRALVAAMAVALVIALGAGLLARAAARQADLATIVSRSAALASENPEVSILLALEAHRRDANPETEQALLNALGSGVIPNRVASLGALNDRPGGCRVQTITPDGMTEFGMVEGLLVSRDTTTGAVTEHGQAPACGRWIGDEPGGRRFAISNDGRTMRLGPFDGPWEIEKQFDHEMILDSRSFTESDRLLFVSFPDGVASVDMLDAATLEPVIPTMKDGDEIVTVENNRDGSRVVLGWARFRGATGDGNTVVLDGTTGEQLFQLDSEVPASRVAFDESAEHLIVALLDGVILTIDMNTWQIVSDVEYQTASRLHDIGVRADGLLVAVSESEIALVDRFSGPTGSVVDLSNASDAVIRSDDTVLILGPGGDLDVIDLEGNALIERSWPVDPQWNVAIWAGQASETAFTAIEPPELIDLSTGDRTELALVLPDGRDYRPFVVWPAEGSVWAMGLGLDSASVDEPFVITRWENGELVEVIEPGLVRPDAFRSGDALAIGGLAPDGPQSVALVSLEPGNAGVRFSVPAPHAWRALPSRDGGLHILDVEDDRVVTVRTYDDTGELVREIAAFPDKPEGVWVGSMAVSPDTGDIAISTSLGELVIDAETEQVEMITDLANTLHHAFARHGELLVAVEGDGTVRLWNLVGGTAAGLAWQGRGAASVESPWYDETTESVWVATSGQVLEIPVDPDRLVERACEVVGRDLTKDEWNRFVPGRAEVMSVCVSTVSLGG